MEQSLSIKLTIVSSNESRRFRLENPTYESLLLLLIKLLKLNDVNQFNSLYSIKYMDNENDLITIDSEDEFTEAVLLSKSTLLLRLQIHSKTSPSAGGNRYSTSNPCNSYRCSTGVPPAKSSTNPCQSRKKWHQLNREALKLFDSDSQSDLELARSLLIQQLELTPNHPITLYNLACIESRLKNLSSAIQYL